MLNNLGITNQQVFDNNCDFDFLYWNLTYILNTICNFKLWFGCINLFLYIRICWKISISFFQQFFFNLPWGQKDIFYITPNWNNLWISLVFKHGRSEGTNLDLINWGDFHLIWFYFQLLLYLKPTPIRISYYNLTYYI